MQDFIYLWQSIILQSCRLKYEDFNRFWQAYPRKVAKQEALRAWKKLKPNEDFVSMLLIALEKFKQSPQWIKDNGQFIPYPATWLNGRRWEEVEEQSAQTAPVSYEFDPNDPYKDRK